MKEERQATPGKGRPMALKTAQAQATPIGEIEVVGEDAPVTVVGERFQLASAHTLHTLAAAGAVEAALRRSQARLKVARRRRPSQDRPGRVRQGHGGTG